MSVIIRLQNLPWNANALDIRRFFNGLSIPDGGVHIIGGSRGDAFIAFGTDEDARQAMIMNGYRILDMPISLFLSSKTEMQNVIEAARGITEKPPAAAKDDSLNKQFGGIRDEYRDGGGSTSMFRNRDALPLSSTKADRDTQPDVGGFNSNRTNESFGMTSFNQRESTVAPVQAFSRLGNLGEHGVGRPLDDISAHRNASISGGSMFNAPERRLDLLTSFRSLRPSEVSSEPFGMHENRAAQFPGERSFPVLGSLGPGLDRQSGGRYDNPPDNMNQDSFNADQDVPRNDRLPNSRPDVRDLDSDRRVIVDFPRSGVSLFDRGPEFSRSSLGRQEMIEFGRGDGFAREDMTGKDREEFVRDRRNRDEGFARERSAERPYDRRGFPVDDRFRGNRDQELLRSGGPFEEFDRFNRNDLRHSFDRPGNGDTENSGIRQHGFKPDFDHRRDFNRHDRFQAELINAGPRDIDFLFPGKDAFSSLDADDRNLLPRPPRGGKADRLPRPPRASRGDVPPRFPFDEGAAYEEVDSKRPRMDEMKGWCVYVDNLPRYYKYSAVRKFFSGCMIPQQGLKMAFDDQYTKGCIDAFMRLEDENSCNMALSYNGHILNGHKIRVEKCTLREFEDAIDGAVSNPNWQEGHALEELRPRSCSQSPRHRSSEECNSKDFCVLMKKLPIKTTKMDVIKFLGKISLHPNAGPYMEVDLDNRPVGRALIGFSREADYRNALGLNRKNMNGTSVIVMGIPQQEFNVRVSRAREAEKTRKSPLSGEKRNEARSNKLGSSDSDKAAKSKKSEKWDRDVCIVMRGLPKSASVASVKQFLNGIETVKDGIYIERDKFGQGTGMAYVQFVGEADYQKGLSRNKQVMEQCQISIFPCSFAVMALKVKAGDKQLIGNKPADTIDLPPERPVQDPVGGDQTVLMRNLNFSVQLGDIMNFFQGFRPIADSIKLQYKNGRLTGDGLVSFESARDADKAILIKNFKMMMGRPITLSIWK